MNVDGELVSPIGIRTYATCPCGAENAVFSTDPSLGSISTWWNPCRRSAVVNKFALPSNERFSSMLGSGYVSLMQTELSAR